jgi:iron complex outermembrane receptor protein
MDYGVSDKLTLSGGVRYTDEDKQASIASLIFNVNSPCNVVEDTCSFDFVDENSWTSWSPKFGLTYQLTDDTLAFAHWTRGYRSGGYNLRNTSGDIVNNGPGPFDQEQVDNYEIGFKASFGSRGYLNGALFLNQIRDMQREVNESDPFSGVVQIIKNTADADILGSELEGAFGLTENLVFRASFGWIDAEYTEVKFDLNGDGAIDELDKGLALPRAAKWTYSVGLTHDLDIGNSGHLNSRINYGYRDDSAFTDSNLGYILDQRILDAGFDFHTSDGRWVVGLYGKNLLDEVKHGGDTQLPTMLGPLPLGGTFSPLAKGRIYGLEFTYTY